MKADHLRKISYDAIDRKNSNVRDFDIENETDVFVKKTLEILRDWIKKSPEELQDSAESGKFELWTKDAISVKNVFPIETGWDILGLLFEPRRGFFNTCQTLKDMIGDGLYIEGFCITDIYYGPDDTHINLKLSWG